MVDSLVLPDRQEGVSAGVFPGQTIFRFFRAHYDSLVALGLLSLLLGWCAWQFHLGFVYTSNETTNLYLRLSRGASWALFPVILALWIPVLRNGLSSLRRSRLATWIPLGYAHRLHMWLGHLFMVLAMVHGTQSLIYQATLPADFTEVVLGTEPDLVRSMQTGMYEFVADDMDIDIVAQWIADGATREGFDADVRPILQADCTKCHSTSSTMTYAKPSMPLVTFEEVRAYTSAGPASRQFRINVTGIVMLILTLALWGFALPPVRRRAHRLFQRSHQLGYGIAVLAVLHVPAWHWMLMPGAALLLEVAINRLWRGRTGASAELTRISEDVVAMTLPAPMPLLYGPGAYVQLRIPALDRHEWHPFSIAGVSRDRVRLLIRCQGDWTRALARQLPENGRDTYLQADLRGPYASPVAEAAESSNLLLIAGGIGITPFLGLLDGLQRQPRRVRRVTLVWVLRSAEPLVWLRPSLDQLAERCGLPVRAWVFLTGADPQDAMPEVAGSKRGAAQFGLFRGRPDWSRLVPVLALPAASPDVFLCGPATLTTAAGRACRQQGWRVRQEVF